MTEFRTTIIQFCETDSFKRYVRAAIQDELFLDRILNHHRVDDQVTSSTKKYLDHHLDSRVHQAVTRQLPAIVRDSHTTQEMLQQHTQQLEQKLTTKSHQIVDTIVNDPNYHVVNERYFQAFQQKGNQQITQVQQRCDHSLLQLNHEINRGKDLDKKTNQLRTITLELVGYSLALTMGGLAYGLYSLS